MPISSNRIPSQKTSLELLAIQSREFESNKKITFAAVLSVFQDLGYVISSAEIQTGFITVTSPTKLSTDPWNSIMTFTKATAFIEELKPGYTRVRLNFVETEQIVRTAGPKARGQMTVEDTPIEDATIYQNAFTKIQEGIFIRKSIH
jgi:hypothetical protein